MVIWTHLGAQVGGEEASRPLPSALCESHISYHCARLEPTYAFLLGDGMTSCAPGRRTGTSPRSLSSSQSHRSVTNGEGTVGVPANWVALTSPPATSPKSTKSVVFS